MVTKQREVNFELPAHLSSFGLIAGREDTEDWDADNGSGPYTLDAYEPIVRFAGKKFDGFYGEDQGHFDAVEVVDVTDPTARASGLLSGFLYVIGSPQPSTDGRLGRPPGFSLIEVAGTQHYTTDMRTDIGPVTNAHLRNAVKLGVKRDEIVQKIHGGSCTPGNDLPISHNQQFHNDQLEQRECNPDKANWHLKQVGTDRVDLTFHTSDGAFSGAVNTAS